MKNIILKKELSIDELLIVSSEMERIKKSKKIAYLLLIFLGWLGIHRFYLGHFGMAILNIALFIFGILLFIFPLPSCILSIIELFILSGAVNKANAKKEIKLIHRVRGIRKPY
ncbi:TM2 domain-containing protein [Paenibacillus sp. SC116]|uniref:TM2 domain-containing protein n=1 Tax=Paenibacillus sp. SC116 TaxID=2968986 RepID=UPI00215A5691|nr:TM2 domain-containing protein [Paenibacillus sp. SC116]MCR8844243.1 TM2 domain-containing protein [Paenibacillus sp. SC116]